jgi:hypothetical protein
MGLGSFLQDDGGMAEASARFEQPKSLSRMDSMPKLEQPKTSPRLEAAKPTPRVEGPKSNGKSSFDLEKVTEYECSKIRRPASAVAAGADADRVGGRGQEPGSRSLEHSSSGRVVKRRKLAESEGQASKSVTSASPAAEDRCVQRKGFVGSKEESQEKTRKGKKDEERMLGRTPASAAPRKVGRPRRASPTPEGRSADKGREGHGVNGMTKRPVRMSTRR